MTTCDSCGNENYEDRIIMDGLEFCCKGCAKDYEEHKELRWDSK